MPVCAQWDDDDWSPPDMGDDDSWGQNDDYSDNYEQSGSGDSIVSGDENVERAQQKSEEITSMGLLRDNRDEFYRWWYNAKFLLDKKLYDKALVSLSRCVELWPDSQEIKLLLEETEKAKFIQFRQELLSEIVVVPSIGLEKDYTQYETYGFTTVDIVSDGAKQFALALAAISRDRRDVALERLERCLALNPDYLPALLENGFILMMSDESGKSESFFERALALNPRGHLENLIYGWHQYFFKADLEKAKKYFLHAIQYGKDTEVAAIARAFVSEINRQELLSDLMISQKLSDIQLLSFGYIEMNKLRRYEASLEEECKAAVSANPSWWFARYALGKAYECLRRWQEAAKSWNQLNYPPYAVHRLRPLIDKYRTMESEIFDPSSPKGRVAKAILLIEAQEYSKGQSELMEALKMDPKLADAHAWLGILLRRTGDSYEAVESLKKALEYDPSYWRARLELGEEYLEQKNLDEAEFELVQAAKDSPFGEMQALFRLGAVRLELTKYDEAYEALTKVINELPNHIEARLALGRLYTEQGEFERAISENETVQRIDPTNWQAPANLGVIYYYQWEMGSGEALLDAAIEKAERALELAPERDKPRVQEYLDIFRNQKG